MNIYDRAYCELRGANSRELAAVADDPKIAAAHLKTAGRFDALASSKNEAPSG
jgi:hypothetical protein